MMTQTYSLAHVERIVKVGAEYGLHLRAAQRLAQAAMPFSSVVRLSRVGTDDEVNGKSILAILSLGAACGDTLFIQARGGDAKEAVNALQAIVEDECPGQ
jgi:phosphotransferase system HPr (HPr) family protein